MRRTRLLNRHLNYTDEYNNGMVLMKYMNKLTSNELTDLEVLEMYIMYISIDHRFDMIPRKEISRLANAINITNAVSDINKLEPKEKRILVNAGYRIINTHSHINSKELTRLDRETMDTVLRVFLKVEGE